MKYIPDVTMESRVPARDYFWNILNTVHPEYVKNVIEHANNLRMKANDETKPAEFIEVSEQWWQKLNAVPFVSCKWIASHLTFLITFITLFLFFNRAQRENGAPSQSGVKASAPQSQARQAEHLRRENIEDC